MTIHIPGPLRSYTREKAEVRAEGGTVREILAELDRKYPGLRFRIINEQDQIREHIKLFRNQQLLDTLDTPLAANDTLHIIAALSGG